MIVKFFPHPKGGGNPLTSMGYLLKKDEHEVQILQGNPRLSVDVAQGLDFKNKYTVGCLSFEEATIPNAHKQEIMQKFEETFFAGLKPEQYNICWIEHTDKGRLELNFFVPNVELESGKRLSVYYDKSDRPLVENFKQVINQTYGLSNPDIPEKRQLTVSSRNIPKDKREAQEAINGFLRGELEKGRIQNREDLLNCLTEAGFEIARVTPKNISIKTDGQNLRLKGAIYEQSFELNRAIEEIQRAKGLGSEERTSEHYKQATAGLEKAVERRRTEFSKRFGTSKASHTQRLNQALQGAILDADRDRASVGIRDGLLRQRGDRAIQSNGGLEAVGSSLQGKQQGVDVGELQFGGQDKQDLYSDRSSIQGSGIRRRSRLPNYQVREELNDTDREAFEGRIRQVDEATKRAYEYIKRTIEQVRAGKPTVEELARKVFRRIEVKLHRKAERQKEMEEEKARISLARGRGLGM
ncbi:relaxase/mobilization nuclease domain-containing protein [Commensalibacter nepenthis]|uniref:Relaxase/mobilization nuclease domain-containing protein n=1 Tax=Commensalibacter nepenthis TaxID=3043872 RepID=A0ABT6QAW9_9PROT|nr:relaxase/mobilization nuclease domain-containing protein [Commensalibacter sp. TBRC 10068]MDI2113954.1 relaxase/mobilization nuclease domain-containing protein [Commensalibacter sp. TBRC 10068]